ncbi:hypothetical protein D3C71_1835990 [compost metagenome]
MRRIQEFQPPELHEWDVPTCQLDLKRSGMARSSEQHGLLFERCSGLPRFKDAFGDITDLISLILDGDKNRLGL